MASKKLTDVPDHLNEEYYQISPDILESFSKFRPPLDIFRFKEEVARIEPFYRVGERLDKERIDELARLTREGFSFVSRVDHPVYVKHIAHQLDLVLVDKNLKEREIADIFAEALGMRLEGFFEQPVKAALDRLNEDLMVLTEYLWNDVYRIRALLRRLRREHTLANHALNCGLVGLGLYLRINESEIGKEITRKTFDHVTLGLFLHDLGMSKIPLFIRNKTQGLTRDEQQKILNHTLVGREMLSKLDLRYKEVEACLGEHHERLDGSGYPQKLKGREIAPLGRLCAVVDSYCAMITDRAHAKAMEPAEAAKILAEDQRRYDPRFTLPLQAMVLASR